MECREISSDLEKRRLKINTIIIIIVIILMMKKCKISRFFRVAEIDFQRLAAGPGHVSVDLKYDVPCLGMFVYSIPA